MPADVFPPGWHERPNHLIYARRSASGWVATTYPRLGRREAWNAPCDKLQVAGVPYDAASGRTALGDWPTEVAAVEAADVLIAGEGQPRVCCLRDIDRVRRDLRGG